MIVYDGEDVEQRKHFSLAGGSAATFEIKMAVIRKMRINLLQEQLYNTWTNTQRMFSKGVRNLKVTRYLLFAYFKLKTFSRNLTPKIFMSRYAMMSTFLFIVCTNFGS